MILKEIQYAINNRPREKLNFDTPKNLFFNIVTLMSRLMDEPTKMLFKIYPIKSLF